MLSNEEIPAIQQFCVKDSKGLLHAFGIIGEHGYYKAKIDGKSVVPFWSRREDAESVFQSNADMVGYEVSDLDVIFLIVHQTSSALGICLSSRDPSYYHLLHGQASRHDTQTLRYSA
jgi:hypothetical protein